MIKYYPGIGLDGGQLSIESPYAPLFFYYDELSKFGEENPDDTYDNDMEALTHFYSSCMKPEGERIKRHLAEGSVLFEDLWALFRPGDMLYAVDESGEPCLQILIAVAFREAQPSPGYSFSIVQSRRLAVDMWRIGWDNATGLFQRVTTTRSIRAFSGSRPITSLPFYPVVHYKGGDAEEIRALKDELQDRGSKWKGLVSQQASCKHYNGPAWNYSQLEKEHVSCPS